MENELQKKDTAEKTKKGPIPGPENKE